MRHTEDVLRNHTDDGVPDDGADMMILPPTSLVNNNKDDDDSFHLSHEAYKLLYISLPSVAIQLSVRTVFPQTASMIGRTLGTRELAAFSLASLTANLTCQSIIMGALTAAETLMPRAYGQERYNELGLLAIRGFIVSTVLLLPPTCISLYRNGMVVSTARTRPRGIQASIPMDTHLSTCHSSVSLVSSRSGVFECPTRCSATRLCKFCRLHCGSSNLVKAPCAVSWFNGFCHVYCHYTVGHDCVGNALSVGETRASFALLAWIVSKRFA